MAASIVSSAAKELGSLVVGEVQYLYHVSDKIEGLQRDLLWMRCFLEDADNIEHQERLVGIWVSQIRDFAYEALDIVETYLHRVSHHRQKGKWNTVKWLSCCLCDAVALHDVGSKIDDLRSRISELTNNLRLYGVQMTKQQGRPEYGLAMREQRQTYSHTKENPIGLENHIKEVVEKLVQSEEVRVVGICGIGGLGKTTLARQVFQNEVINKYFEKNCVWVYISKQFEKKAVFKEILVGLKCNSGAGDKDREERDRIEKLGDGELPREICDVLKDKKCLVVLDDMWKYDDWDKLKAAFEFTPSLSSKILITTRNKGLLEYAAKGPIGYSHPFGTLKVEDSWALLESILFPRNKVSDEASTPGIDQTDQRKLKGEAPTVGRDQTDQTKLERNKDTTSADDTPNTNAATSKEEGQAGEAPTRGRHQNDQTEPHEVENKKNLAKEMLKHCNGLPLAIRALGGVLLSKKIVSEWETVQKNLSYYLLSNREKESGSEGLFGVLESSYNDLPYYLKPCFLYMGMFPEDHEIEAEELFHLWEAEGLVTSSLDGGDELHDVLLDDIAEMYLNQLVERSMVQVEKTWPNGRIKSCRLHDIMRDMCLKKCREGNFLNIIEQKISTDSSNLTARGCLLNRRMRRCVVHDSGCLDPLLDPDLSNNTPCIRSLIVFAPAFTYERKLVAENKRKLLSQLRVLYISKYAEIPEARMTVRDSIHLRFLKVGCTIGLISSRLWKCLDLSAYFWEWKNLETLDLSDCEMFVSSIKFWKKLERLRHLYLPVLVVSKNSGKLCLSTNQLRQIETLKNFDMDWCEIEDLKQMNNLRNFSFRRGWPLADGKALEVLLKSPMITRKPLVEPFDLIIDAETMNKDPSILIKSEAIYIEELEVNGRIDGNVVDAKAPFPHSLEQVTLEDCEISAGGISALGNLPRLKCLEFRGNAIEGNSMCFSNGSFPCLHTLTLCRVNNLEKWEVGEWTCPSLEKVRLEACEISTGVITVLGKHPRLKHLMLVKNEGNSMCFSDRSFPCLHTLTLLGVNNLEKWEVGEGTCPSLEEVCLEACEIRNGVITVLGNLPSLKHLLITRSAIEGNRMSFSDESFSCLEHLELDGMKNLKEWEVGEGTCPSLEEVRLKACEIRNGVITVLGNLPRLKHLLITRSAIEGNRLSFSDGSFPYLEHLELDTMKYLKEWEVGEGTCPSLEEECLEACEISTGVITVLGNLPCLKHLLITRSAIEGNRMSFCDGSFPCLEHLELHEIKNLKEWEVEEGTCPSLEKVHLDYCLFSTGVITVLGNLPRLKHLEIIGSAIKGNRMSFSHASFPCLEHLELLGMENLKKWEVGEGTCPSLRQLDVWGCKKLKLIPEGLPNSLEVRCSPCVKGCEKYGGCRLR